MSPKVTNVSLYMSIPIEKKALRTIFMTSTNGNHVSYTLHLGGIPSRYQPHPTGKTSVYFCRENGKRKGKELYLSV